MRTRSRVLIVHLGIIIFTSNLFGQKIPVDSTNLASINFDYTSLYNKIIDSDSSDQLKYLSQLTIMLREKDESELLNSYLLKYAGNPASIYPERAVFWIAENYLKSKQYEKSRSQIEDISFWMTLPMKICLL